MSYSEDSEVHWRRRGPKDYIVKSLRPQFIAQVFGSPSGLDWAWAVWHEHGLDSGIESRFRTAKDRAEEVIQKLTGRA